jgi:hypothetical protein
METPQISPIVEEKVFTQKSDTFAGNLDTEMKDILGKLP